MRMIWKYCNTVEQSSFLSFYLYTLFILLFNEMASHLSNATCRFQFKLQLILLYIRSIKWHNNSYMITFTKIIWNEQRLQLGELISTTWILILNKSHENTFRKNTPIKIIVCKCYRIAILISDKCSINKKQKSQQLLYHGDKYYI